MAFDYTSMLATVPDYTVNNPARRVVSFDNSFTIGGIKIPSLPPLGGSPGSVGTPPISGGTPKLPSIDPPKVQLPSLQLPSLPSLPSMPDWSALLNSFVNNLGVLAQTLGIHLAFILVLLVLLYLSFK